MPKLLPDQTFYPSPTMAMQAPVETLAYVALLNPDPAANDALAVLDVDPGSPGCGAQLAPSTCRRPATSCTTSGGTPAARACVRTRPIRTCTVAILSCRACDRRGSTFSTPRRIHGGRAW